MTEPDRPERHGTPDEHAADIAELERKSGTAARLFDIRSVIGGLFVFYGLLIGAAGLFTDEDALAKAQGININLWTGLAMLLVGGFFLLWLKTRPLRAEPPNQE
ncbi:hypothetical protein OOZ19_26670 [Saccharopolyspora sp. NFXS83]|uniref:hypothetical protein n=1 Tax=Saccharopolyspora sp. NFXS83 TaxID=2993560 RepID=UPI00224B8A61|nr:hypothetical protein [Saccharopolyspora sp. NFXS83]MCX2733844.1 hypothetical protein [Saccharopolyspora sp. NFXS83]